MSSDEILQLINLALILTILVGSIIVVLVVGFRSDLGGDQYARSAKLNFDAELKSFTGLPLLKPTTVSVYQRRNWTELNDEGDEDVVYDTNTYNERLLVVKPNNWIVYTGDGITFHYIVTDLNRSRSLCANAEHLNAVRYTLRAIGDEQTYSSRIRHSCVEYTLDDLIRIFVATGNRTDLDLTDYFDSRKTEKAPLFTVENVLEFLVVNGYV